MLRDESPSNKMPNTQSPIATLQFLGAAETVTGSKHLLRIGNRQVLLDCGLFQGLKQLRLRNWADPPFTPGDIDAVILSHAHIDHTGYLPLLTRRGFQGRVYSTPGTRSLARIMLPDSARIQEEQAAHANKHGYSKHHPAEPLYRARDVERCLQQFKSRPYGGWFEVSPEIHVRYRRAGHILGSAIVELQLGRSREFKLVFSGDLGRWNRPMLKDPEFVDEADVLLVESTYGNRDHPDTDVREELARVVNESAERGGALLIPAFAVGRVQELIWYLRELEDAGRIPKLPVFLDSPMATDVTEIFCQHPEDHDIDMKLLMDEHRCPLCCKPYTFTRSPAESKQLNFRKGPMIIIAASGMATNGRIVHHLERRLPNKKTTVLLVGFQAIGTRGRQLQNGARHVRMHGRDVPVRAHVGVIHGLSAHADRRELLRWLDGFKSPPKHTHIVHGEPDASQVLAETLRSDRGWTVDIARDGETVELFHEVPSTPAPTNETNTE